MIATRQGFSFFFVAFLLFFDRLRKICEPHPRVGTRIGAQKAPMSRLLRPCLPPSSSLTRLFRIKTCAKGRVRRFRVTAAPVKS